MLLPSFHLLFVSVVLRAYIAGICDNNIMGNEYKANGDHGDHAFYHGDEISTTNFSELMMHLIYESNAFM